MLIHLDSIERELDTLESQLERIAASERWHRHAQTSPSMSIAAASGSRTPLPPSSGTLRPGRYLSRSRATVTIASEASTTCPRLPRRLGSRRGAGRRHRWTRVVVRAIPALSLLSVRYLWSVWRAVLVLEVYFQRMTEFHKDQGRRGVMRVIRLVGLAVGAVVAMSFAVVSSASAFSSNPLFITANGQSGRSVGLGNAVLAAAGNVITCAAHQVVSKTVSDR
jgi:hypothetical protein